jgi:hypothetical protein
VSLSLVFVSLFIIVILGTTSVFARGKKSPVASGNTDRPGMSTMCNHHDIAINQQSGDLFVCDYDNNSINKVSPTGVNRNMLNIL